jgi:hypothetical protein
LPRLTEHRRAKSKKLKAQPKFTFFFADRDRNASSLRYSRTGAPAFPRTRLLCRESLSWGGCRLRAENGAGFDAHVIRDAHLSAHDYVVFDHALPERPVCAAMTTSSPMRTLWPTWTRLSIFVPRQMRVSSSAPRSTVELAPISTSSSMTSRPTWGIVRSVRFANRGHSRSLHCQGQRPACTTTRSPRVVPG